MKIRTYLLLWSIFLVACNSDSESPEEEMPVVTIPTLSTLNATSITKNSATVGGNITNDGGGQITERGVVWSTNSSPTTLDTKVSIGTGSGEFSGAISNLERNTQYFLKAYAINSEGTAYGNEISFTTTASLPDITTIEVSEITENSAKSGGEITDDGGSAISTRGICWSTSPNPTIEDHTFENGEGLGAFSSELMGLEPDTEYYLRAYAENSAGISYGNELSFTTNAVSLKTFEGDVILESQQEVNEFGSNNYESITGDLILRNSSDLTNLTPLVDLIEIGGKLVFTNNNSLVELNGLENLRSIGGNLALINNNKILDLTVFENLDSINGKLSIYNNDALVDIKGLSKIVESAARIEISYNDRLTKMSSFIDVEELIIITDLYIINNNLLESLNDFSSLISVSGNLRIDGNSSLQDLSGFDQLTEIKGDLYIGNNGIVDLDDFNSLEKVVGDIKISNNDELEALDGFSVLNHVGSISIDNNDNLRNTGGFGSLEVLTGGLWLNRLGFDQEISAFANLNNVLGNVHISSSFLLNLNFLSNLRQIGGDFIISDAGSLGSPMGLENLERIGGDMIFRDTLFDDLDNFPKLVEVGGFLALGFNKYLRSIEFTNLKSVGEGVLIEGNLDSLFNLDDVWGLESIGSDLIVKTNNSSLSGTGLTNLKAFENLNSVGGGIELTNNPNLEDYCDLRNLLTTFTGSFIVDGNGFNPSQQDVVDGNCSQ